MHTDEDLRMAATFAYVDFGSIYEDLSKTDEGPITIEMIIKSQGGYNSEFCKNNDIVACDNGSIIVKGVEIPQEYLTEWSIISTYEPNGNDDNGFFGCVIDTGNNEAIVAFRGSNKFTELSNYVKDWSRADFRLLVENITGQVSQESIEYKAYIDELNKEATAQHDSVINYMNELEASGILKNYKLDSTGHSLGGNLSMFFTMLSANYSWGDNIYKCLNFDGPFFNRETISKYIGEIRKMGDKIYHCQYSGVGSVFMENTRDYVHVKHGDIDKQKYEENLKLGDSQIVNDITLSTIVHPTKYVLIGEDGMIVEGEPTNTALFLSALTCELDNIPGEIQIRILTELDSIIYELFGYDPNDPKDKLDARNIDFSKLPEALINNFGGTIEILSYVTVSTIAVLYDHPEFIATALIDAVYDGLTKLNIYPSEIIEQHREFCHNLWNKVQSKVKEYHLNIATNYSNDNPIINVDTDALREYARRIGDVNNRLANIDSRLNGLYNQVGFWDLLKIIRADMLTGYNWHLTKCKTYLENTANNFDDAEWQNIDMFK